MVFGEEHSNELGSVALPHHLDTIQQIVYHLPPILPCYPAVLFCGGRTVAEGVGYTITLSNLLGRTGQLKNAPPSNVDSIRRSAHHPNCRASLGGFVYRTSSLRGTSKTCCQEKRGHLDCGCACPPAARPPVRVAVPILTTVSTGGVTALFITLPAINHGRRGT